MGYPMTFQRLLARNRLKDGDYAKVPEGLSEWAGWLGYVKDAFSEKERALLDERNQSRQRFESWAKLFAGDLRRLEKDATDEKAIAMYIAQRTGIDPDVVAAVLKEFINW